MDLKCTPAIWQGSNQITATSTGAQQKQCISFLQKKQKFQIRYREINAPGTSSKSVPFLGNATIDGFKKSTNDLPVIKTNNSDSKGCPKNQCVYYRKKKKTKKSNRTLIRLNRKKCVYFVNCYFLFLNVCCFYFKIVLKRTKEDKLNTNKEHKNMALHSQK